MRKSLKVVLRKQEARIRQLEDEAGDLRASLSAVSQGLADLAGGFSELREERAELDRENLKEELRAQKLFNEGLSNILNFGTGVKHGKV